MDYFPTDRVGYEPIDRLGERRGGRLASVRDAGERAIKNALGVGALGFAFILGTPTFNAMLQGALGTPWPRPNPWLSALPLLGPGLLAMVVWQIVAGRVDALPDRRAFAIAHRLHWPLLALSAIGMALVVLLG